jgi:hypothetical protein
MPNWYPGQVAVGQKVFAEVIGMTRGFWSQPPAITNVGTVLTGGTVTNSTGYDCMVYMSSTTGISKVVFNNGSTVSAGTVAPAQVLPVYVPAGYSLTPSYSGTLTWTWLAV